MDQFEAWWTHGHRSDQEGVEIGLIGMAGQVVEEIDGVSSPMRLGIFLEETFRFCGPTLHAIVNGRLHLRRFLPAERRVRWI